MADGPNAGLYGTEPIAPCFAVEKKSFILNNFIEVGV